MHIYDMFNEILVMDSRGPKNFMFNNMHWYLCLYVSFHLCKFHEVIGSDLVLLQEFSLKSHSCWHSTGRKRLQLHSCKLMGATGALSHLEGLVRERLGL